MWSEYAIIVLATSAISYTIARGTIFERVRWYLEDKAKEGHLPWTFLGDLVKCAYCLAHWVALCLVLCSSARFLQTDVGIVVDYLVSTMAVVAGSSLVIGVIMQLFYPRTPPKK